MIDQATTGTNQYLCTRKERYMVIENILYDQNDQIHTFHTNSVSTKVGVIKICLHEGLKRDS